MSIKWTIEEDKVLLEIYPLKGIHEALKLLPNRTVAAICCRASGLGIKLRPGYYQRLWSDEEKEIVRKVWPTATIDDVLKSLPSRPYNQIKLQAQKLGVVRQVPLWYREVKHIKLPLAFCAYLAGLFDGEGSIVLHISRSEYLRYTPEVSIANTDIAVLEDIKKELAECGLACYLYRRRIVSKYKPIGQLKIQDHGNSLAFLNAMLPYLRIKRKKAELVLEILRRKVNMQSYDDLLEEFKKLKDPRYCEVEKES